MAASLRCISNAYVSPTCSKTSRRSQNTCSTPTPSIRHNPRPLIHLLKTPPKTTFWNYCARFSPQFSISYRAGHLFTCRVVRLRRVGSAHLGLVLRTEYEVLLNFRLTSQRSGYRRALIQHRKSKIQNRKAHTCPIPRTPSRSLEFLLAATRKSSAASSSAA